MVEASLSVAAWETAGYLATGEVPQRPGDRRRLNAPYSLLERRDGRWIAFCGAREHFFRRVMKVLGLENEAADPRFAKSYLRKQNETALLDVMFARHQEMGGATRTRGGADGGRRSVLARK